MRHPGTDPTTRPGRSIPMCATGWLHVLSANPWDARVPQAPRLVLKTSIESMGYITGTGVANRDGTRRIEVLAAAGWLQVQLPHWLPFLFVGRGSHE